ncbi:DNA (cytosine-5-)-methyltransferase [Aquella oligotrophica]|uniref:Cytosine-specific methyltransferase n=1 Tax=Aquella oligotrophica TaxID=2067065 RepID=A0A2I7N9K9_9NEIS|nr:DNA (cytosine-5-)-methyltransferase [Aquella oligotrophica]
MTFIDLFAGAGGLSEGFIQAGYTPIAHVEIDSAACKTLKTRSCYYYLRENHRYDVYLDYLSGKITRDELYNHLPESEHAKIINSAISTENNEQIFSQINNSLNGREVDLIIGGPPCQAYSVVGRSRSADGMQNDARNYMYLEYVKYLNYYRPKMFVFENVLGLQSAQNGKYLTDMQQKFRKSGYEIEVFRLNARAFGVLQNRVRLIIVGCHIDVGANIPDLKQINFMTDKKFLVADLFTDLPALQNGEGSFKRCNYAKNTINEYLVASGIRSQEDVLTQHVTRPHNDQDLEIYRIAITKWLSGQQRLDYADLPKHLKTHKNETAFTDRFKVVGADLNASHTMVAHISKDGHYYIHPDLKQNRSISIREAARIQSFPDNYYFEGYKSNLGSRTAAFRQIGNAVPPLMAKQIAAKMKEML